jgi:hypothetical protein
MSSAGAELPRLNHPGPSQTSVPGSTPFFASESSLTGPFETKKGYEATLICVGNGYGWPGHENDFPPRVVSHMNSTQ